MTDDEEEDGGSVLTTFVCYTIPLFLLLFF